MAKKERGVVRVGESVRKGVRLTVEEREAVMVAVVERMYEGETLADTVEALDVVVTPGTVRDWLLSDPVWREAYGRAKVALGQALAEEAIRVARETTNYSSSSDRVLIDTLKWAAARTNPGEWGDRQVVEHSGSQVLEVKVVEDEGIPVRNAAALTAGAATAATMLAAGSGAIAAIAVPAEVIED